MQIKSGSIDETAELAAKLARNIRGNEAIEFASDLGGGKTAFTRFLASELGSQDTVSSPSFTIENIYRTPKFDIHHFDFYRLEEAGIMQDELLEVIEEDDSLAIIEWAGIVGDVLPAKRLRIEIVAPTEHSREFSFIYPSELDYLLEGIA